MCLWIIDLKMAQPSTPSASIFGLNLHVSHNNQSAEAHNTPASATSSNNTFLMPNSPIKGRRNNGEIYRPKITRTLGQRPACLVNASVTYCGDNTIYAFGGFDQYVRLDLQEHNFLILLIHELRSWDIVSRKIKISFKRTPPPQISKIFKLTLVTWQTDEGIYRLWCAPSGVWRSRD